MGFAHLHLNQFFPRMDPIIRQVSVNRRTADGDSNELVMGKIRTVQVNHPIYPASTNLCISWVGSGRPVLRRGTMRVFDGNWFLDVAAHNPFIARVDYPSKWWGSDSNRRSRGYEPRELTRLLYPTSSSEPSSRTMQIVLMRHNRRTCTRYQILTVPRTGIDPVFTG